MLQTTGLCRGYEGEEDEKAWPDALGPVPETNFGTREPCR
jgi:hypothetical protein